MKDDLRYTPSDCFETFPFPNDWRTQPTLEAPGKAYYEFRAAVMLRSGEGLTKTYNRFHDPDEREPEILKLRELLNAERAEEEVQSGAAAAKKNSKKPAAKRAQATEAANMEDLFT